MAKKNDKLKKIDSLENKIAKDIYGTDKKVTLVDQELKEIQNKINQLNQSYRSFVNGNIIEFMTSVEFSNDKYDNSNKKKNSKEGTKENIQKFFETQNIADLTAFEKERAARYDDYKVIYSYIPQLAACIKVYTNCIISPDDFTKSSINFLYKDTIISKNSDDIISKNIKTLITKYQIEDKLKEYIKDTLVLGDTFIAILDYNQEINKYLLNENNESLNISSENKFFLESSDIPINSEFKLLCDIVINESNIGNKVKQNYLKKDNSKPIEPEIYKDIQSSLLKMINGNINYNENGKSLLKGDSKINEFLNKKSKNKDNSDTKQWTNFGFNGSIIRKLKPENVIKLEVDGINLGYLYIEKDETSPSNLNPSVSSTGNDQSIGTGLSKDFFNSRYDINENGNQSGGYKTKEEAIINLFMNGISKKLDNEFIKDNKEFKDILYVLLKDKYILEKKVNITYLTDDEVVHFAVDKYGTYGQSRLANSLFFAKIYLATLITELMQKISRGRDKRLIYVETSVDDDIEGVVQSVARDIKSKEISSDLLKSVTTVLNYAGSFDDYYLPLVDGEKPIDFDTLQGMDVSADNDFLEYLLKSMIQGTGLPVNYIDASQEVDFARTLAMQSSTFVENIVSDQSQLQPSATKLIQILYENEYQNENVLNYDNKNKNGNSDDNVKKKRKKDSNYIDVNSIIVSFPVPISLTMNNTNEQIGNSTQILDFAISTYYSENSDDPNADLKKLIFKKNLAKKILPNLDWDMYDDVFRQTEIEAMASILNKPSDDTSGDTDMDDDF